MSRIHFTEEEQRAIVKVLGRVMVSDKHIDIREVDFLEEIVSHLNIDKVTMFEGNSMSFKEALSILERTSIKKKQILDRVFIAMAQADNIVRKQEKELLLKISKYLEI